MKKNSMATWRTTRYNQKTRSARKRQQLWGHGNQLFWLSHSIMLCAYISCTVTYMYSINYHPWLKATDRSKISINAICLKKHLTQSEEMVFIWRVWEHKLITSTLQLGKLIYHKPNSYYSVLRQWNLSVSQSMKRWVNYQPVFQSVIYLPNNT